MLAYNPDDDSMPRLLGECCFVCPVLCGGGGARAEIIEDQKGSQDLLERSIPRILLAVDLQKCAIRVIY
jgi:hypothetical protein